MSAGRAVRVVVRIVLAVALLALLVLNGVKHGPDALAAIGARPAPSSVVTRTIAAPSTSTTTSAAVTPSTPAPTLSTPAVSVPPVSGGGGGGGGGGGKTTRPKPVITSFSVTPSVVCPLAGTESPAVTAQNPLVSVSWTSTGAVTAFFGINTNDAQKNPTLDKFQPSDGFSWEYACPQPRQLYTITVVAADGQKATRSAVVTATGGVSG